MILRRRVEKTKSFAACSMIDCVDQKNKKEALMNLFFYDFPAGAFGIVEKDGAIAALIFPNQTAPLEAEYRETDLTREAAGQLSEYFAGTRRVFDLPLLFEGTPFQKAVWAELLRIPYGETRSYLDVAKAIGNPKAVRAVGAANGRNPIPVIGPCHRVIGASGGLTGFGGGLELKRQLLALERGERPW